MCRPCLGIDSIKNHCKKTFVKNRGHFIMKWIFDDIQNILNFVRYDDGMWLYKNMPIFARDPC